MSTIQQMVYAFGVLFLMLVGLTLVAMFGSSLSPRGDVAMLVVVPSVIGFLVALFYVPKKEK